MKLKVTAHARLHFGFLDLSEDAGGRRFGGLGMSLTAPRLVLRLEPAPGLQVVSPRGARTDPQAARIEALAERVHRVLELKPRARIVIEEMIPEHVGLGSGTQTALALATLIARQHRIDQPVARLCALAGRAQRSGVGFHLFQSGGFVVEGGHARGGVAFEVPPLLARHEIPEDWRVVVALPVTDRTVSGEMEDEAFRRLRPATATTVERISRLVLTRLLPALVSRDLKSFGAALTETQELVGRCFAPVQEGEFHPAGALLAARLKEEGACGVGQSSWGPAVYAFATDTAEEERLAGIIERADPGARVLRVRGLNRGAGLVVQGSAAAERHADAAAQAGPHEAPAAGRPRATAKAAGNGNGRAAKRSAAAGRARRGRLTAGAAATRTGSRRRDQRSRRG
jgi:beta-RFAP synthase